MEGDELFDEIPKTILNTEEVLVDALGICVYCGFKTKYEDGEAVKYKRIVTLQLPNGKVLPESLIDIFGKAGFRVTRVTHLTDDMTRDHHTEIVFRKYGRDIQ